MRKPVAPSERRDDVALLLAAGGATLLFAGAGIGPSTSVAVASAFVAAGAALFVALILWERGRRDALMPVSQLATTFPIIGALGTIGGTMIYTAIFTTGLLVLERLDGR